MLCAPPPIWVSPLRWCRGVAAALELDAGPPFLEVFKRCLPTDLENSVAVLQGRIEIFTRLGEARREVLPHKWRDPGQCYPLISERHPESGVERQHLLIGVDAFGIAPDLIEAVAKVG